MANQNKKRIDLFEAGFFLMESATTPMSGVGTDIYRIPKNYKGNFVNDLYRSMLKTDVVEPFNQIIHWNRRFPHRSYWTTADHIDMAEHIKRHHLPSPGTDEQLHDLIELLLSTPLDRSVPLWECHIVEGLKNNRFAICVKAHHASLDGTSGMARLAGCKSTDPKDKSVRGVWSSIPGIHDKAESTAQASKELGHVVRRLATGPLEFAGQARKLWEAIIKNGGVVNFVKENWLPGAPGNTTFNVKGGFGKRVSAVRLSKTRAIRIAKANHCTVNDVFLACVSGAMNRYLSEAGETIDKSLKAIIPMSLRDPDDVAPGNKITNIFVNLGKQNQTNLQRLASISRDTRAKKAIARTADKNLLLAYTALTGGASGLMSMTGLNAQTSNVLVSNVPGPKQKLYLMGAELQEWYAFNVLPPGISMIIVAFSYRNSLDISLVAHRTAVPDIDRIARFMNEVFVDLYESV